MGLNRRLERRLEVVLPLGRRAARPGHLRGRRFARPGRGRFAGKRAYSKESKLTPSWWECDNREDRRAFLLHPLSAPTTPVSISRGVGTTSGDADVRDYESRYNQRDELGKDKGRVHDDGFRELRPPECQPTAVQLRGSGSDR